MRPEPTSAHFRPALFAFLRELAENNNREWFQTNKSRYLLHVQETAQQFISDFGPLLRQISREFMQLLSYPEDVIDAKLEAGGQDDPFILLQE